MNCVKSILGKEVVNVKCGEVIGCVSDILVDTTCGSVKSIVVPKKNNAFSVFSKKDNYYINWCDIVKVGKNLILVDTNIITKNED